jgi:hypothetical protein
MSTSKEQGFDTLKIHAGYKGEGYRVKGICPFTLYLSPCTLYLSPFTLHVTKL